MIFLKCKYFFNIYRKILKKFELCEKQLYTKPHSKLFMPF